MTGAMRSALAGALAATLLLGGCASAPNRTPGDPLEPMNRAIFGFNEGVDRYVLEPVATGWDWALPESVQRSISNFFSNLRFPVVFANSVFQGKPRRALDSMARFGVNTTVGLAGLFDPAEGWGLEPVDEDFGQTLAEWGVGDGPYLVLPLLGPSNPRDALASPLDSALGIVTWVVDTPVWLGVRGVQVVNTRARFLEEVRENRKMSFDYYVFVRDAWLDFRRNQILDGASKPDEAQEDLYHPDYQ